MTIPLDTCVWIEFLAPWPAVLDLNINLHRTAASHVRRWHTCWGLVMLLRINGAEPSWAWS